MLTAEEFKEAVGGTTNKDYETQENTDTKWLNTSVPQEAFRKEYPKSMLFVLPNKQDFGGMSFFIPSAFVGEDKNSDDGRILIRLPEDFVIKAQSRDETREATLTAYDFNRLCNNTTAEDYKRKARREAKRRASGITFPFPKRQELRASTIAPYSECPTASIRIIPIIFLTSV